METISRFNFSDYRVEKSSIEITSEDISSKLSIDLSVEGKAELEKCSFILYMDVKVWDENRNINIYVRISALFKFDPDCKEKELGAYFNTNAPALLFPYVRSYITALTALSGINPPIVLPTLNLSQLGEELKQNTTHE